MTPEEFGKFLDTCRTVFSEVNRLTAGRDHEAASRRELWQQVLTDVDLDQAERYVDAVLKGDEKPPEYRSEWDVFPATVRQWCRRNKPVRWQASADYADEPRYRCLKCRDTGWAVLLSLEWIREAWDDIEADRWPQGWYQQARNWCRRNGHSLVAAYKCPCEGRESTRGITMDYSGSIGIKDAASRYVASHEPTDSLAWTP